MMEYDRLIKAKIEKEAEDYSAGFGENDDKQSFIDGANWAKRYYELILDEMENEIKERVYGKDKMSFITAHLLRNFSQNQLMAIRDFLISRTPKDENK